MTKTAGLSQIYGVAIKQFSIAGVVLSTDKTSYAPDEQVTFNIVNQSGQSIKVTHLYIHPKDEAVNFFIKPLNTILNAGQTFTYVWDRKDLTGKFVYPGTYPNVNPGYYISTIDYETSNNIKSSVFNLTLVPTDLKPDESANFGKNEKPVFAWNATDIASSGYHFQISKDKDFSQVVFEQTSDKTTVDGSVFWSSLSNGWYYWRVIPVGPKNQFGVSSEIRSVWRRN